jgi:phosphatidylglycerophosphate synthase
VLPCSYMQLHHTNGRPDWANVRPERRNYWQRFAVSTKGIATPGNAVSSAGLVVVAIGVVLVLHHHVAEGMWLIIAGRLCDVIDGFVADYTGTKSPLGGAVDATFDKLGALGILLAVGFGSIVPWWIVALITLQNGINSVIGLRAWRQKIDSQPVRSGKLSTALTWISLSCFLLAAAYDHVWLWPAYITLVPALVLGGVSTVVYAKALSAPDALRRG